MFVSGVDLGLDRWLAGIQQEAEAQYNSSDGHREHSRIHPSRTHPALSTTTTTTTPWGLAGQSPYTRLSGLIQSANPSLPARAPQSPHLPTLLLSCVPTTALPSTLAPTHTQEDSHWTNKCLLKLNGICHTF